MRTLKIYGTPNGKFLDEITRSLSDGQIIVYPTDTLYAYGCDALNNRAVEKICSIKGVDPKKHPLAVVCADMSQAARYARIDNRAFDIMRRYTPGPFTFILPAASSLPKVFKGRKEVGVRIPDDPTARKIAEAIDAPILSTSIELPADTDSELTSEATMELIERFAPDIDLFVDAGSRSIQGSAVISLIDPSNPEILREGPVGFEG